MSIDKYVKFPDEVIDVVIDYTDWFSNRSDNPGTVTFSPPAGLTLASTTMSGKMVRLTLSGGTAGSTYHGYVYLSTDGAPPRKKAAEFLVFVRPVV